jgi:catechol 2,3-dioxygenase-like lactoylglutathione lyase family enzyme
VRPFVEIDHVQLAIPRGGEDRAREFYVDVLGLKETRKPPELAGRGGLWLESGNVDGRATDGDRHCYLFDPFGNRIELVERHGA